MFIRNLLASFMFPLMFAENDLGGGNPVVPAAEPIPSAPAAPAAPATPVAVPAAPPTPGAPEGFVPSYRLRETREAAVREAQTRYEAQIATMRAEADRYKAQLHSIVGATPPPNPEINAVRDQFGKLYPGLAKLEERQADIDRLLERAGDVEAQNTHYWQSYGRQTMDRLFAQAAESLGSPLTDEGKRQLHASFTGFVSSSPELTARYANDPTIVEDFWRQFTSSFIDPVRRSAAAGVVNRVPGALPQDTPGGMPLAPGAPKPANLEERANQAWVAFQASKTR